MAEELLRVEGLQVQFNTPLGRLKAISNATFTINEGEAFGLVGESGCGKSVTALSILRLLPTNARISSGKIIFKGRNLLELSDEEFREVRGKEISIVFQDPQTSLDPVYTISNQISEAINIHQPLSSKELDEKVVELLKSVGIPEPNVRKDQYPHQFSGGMKQRATSAIAVSNNPSLIVADEPTTALDVTVQAQIVDLLKTLKKDLKISILLITHDMGLIAELCDRVAVMYAGYVVENSDVFSIFRNPRHPYTRGLIDSIPRLDVAKDELESIPGRLPNPYALPNYCVFQPRCKYAKDICLSGMPELLEVGNGTKAACYLAQKDELRFDS